MSDAALDAPAVPSLLVHLVSGTLAGFGNCIVGHPFGERAPPLPVLSRFAIAH